MPATTSAGTRSQVGRVEQRRGDADRERHADRDLPQGNDPHAHPVGPSARGDPRDAAEDLCRGERARDQQQSPIAAVVVEKEDKEADQAQLCGHVEGACRRRSATPSDLGAGARARSARPPVRPGSAKAPTIAARRHAQARPIEGSVDAHVLLQRGQRAGGHRPAERHGHLANPERKTALLRPEPSHHRPAAGRVHARADPACDGERADELGERRRVGRPDESPRCPRLPDCDTARSPTRSATRPQASSVASDPKLTAASTTPTCVRVSPNWCRMAGAIAGSPRRIAEYAACARTPAARIVQR